MIIGVSGKMGSGKDSVGEILQKLFEGKRYFPHEGWVKVSPKTRPFQNRKFAKKLKQSVELKFPTLFEEKLWETLGDEYRNEYLPLLGMTRRDLLMKEGMGLRNVVCADYWLSALMCEYDGTQDWIITDMRLKNEFNKVREGVENITIRVVRPNMKFVDCVSETDLNDLEDQFDIVIRNCGNYQDLIEQVTREFLKHLFLRIK
ncbi:hypothetical protein Phi19:2_gp065 [Cellulophaga phage phi19:2]|uniref:Deoxynucleoside monophosphate kinase n=3 Tax=Cellulophaga phage phiST TaxID=756282 RepID=M4SL87_9CAUD|nr:hypothetical protein CGPG_00044 [Cellulophaga phage phiST]AGH56743.1 hypothetical protein CGPG_00044 [Cellulophaga phage phiST]AGO47204.1 hypothetical protein PhiST_gp065 [Cellulophaga phage phiST]AGO48700.1 hypothetical protein Phi19:2_gp065 [Cellulophaga phage phi19:2]AGO49070.1 hypothetical protein Phi13:1_gp059 [Cellulophaga phage phi13:1]